tara:strand:- start:1575 stop:2720 length:1146 start_codon:yes stop_codon:yes gene_type:complete
MADTDIVRNYDWTSVPANSPLREEAPQAICTAHNLDSNQLQQFVNGYLNTVRPASEENSGIDDGIAFYRGLYKGGKQLGTYFFPFFTDDYRAFTNEYADSFSPISQRGAQMIGAEVIENLAGAGEKLIGGGVALGKGLLSVGSSLVDGVKSMGDPGAEGGGASAEGFKGIIDKIGKGARTMQGSMAGTKTVGAPGSYIETPKFYQYAPTDQGLQLSFALSNTLSDKGAQKNAEFIKEFTMINRPTREGPLGMTFPAIYHIEVPGLRYIEWASLDNFSVSMQGQRRRINGVIQPEAYIINLTFTSLTIEPANFMKMVKTPGQDPAEYEYKRAEALGLLRTQAARTGGVFSQFSQLGTNLAADAADAQLNAARRSRGQATTNQ